MNHLVKNHYTIANTIFSEVLSLVEDKPSWEELEKKNAGVPRGWFELCQLATKDRIEFIKEFWLKTLPYSPKTHAHITSFFKQIEDVGVYVVQLKNEEARFAEFIYSLQGQACFFRGGLFLQEEEINAVNLSFEHALPKDYLAFFHIHNGFAKHNDIGIIKLDRIKACQDQLFKDLEKKDLPPHFMYERDSLIPFYECFGLHSFQCFFKEWRPTSEIGNVYFSGIDYTISNTAKREEDLAFETFLEWLVFYLEGRET